MEQKKTRLYTALAIGIFAAVFAALLTVATLYDLDVSKILTKNALPDGAYFSTSNFGLFFEAVGSAPIYLMAAVGGAVGFWWGIRKKDIKAVQIAVPIACAVIVFVGVYLFVSDIFSYLGEHMRNEEFMGSGYVTCLTILLTLIISALLVLTWKQISAESNEKLIKWCFVILITLALYLIVHFIKSPIGRVRFRTMNYLGDSQYSYYTRWYVVNGKRNIVPLAEGVEITDSCKSFPSGHTFSAALIYTMLCLPDLLPKWNKKWVKIVLYVGTIGFTGMVAISRIMVGAHYMSDVLFGGTLSFLAMVIAREIVIFRGAHILSLFGKTVNIKE